MKHSTQIARLRDGIQRVEERACSRSDAEAFQEWIAEFAVPCNSLPKPGQELPTIPFCCEGIDIFYTLQTLGGAVACRPYVPNATDSDLPHDKTIGYLIPLDRLGNVPNVEWKYNGGTCQFVGE